MQLPYVKLHRKLLDSMVFDNPNVLKVWVWALLRANYKTTDVLIGRQVITLNPGQFIFGRDSAAEQLKMGASTVRNYIALLVKLGNLDIKSFNKFSIITVKNWTTYQQVGQQSNNKVTTTGQQQDTDKKDKKDKNLLTNVSNTRRREDIDAVISHLEGKLGTSLDGTQKKNRQYAKLLLDRMKKDYPDLDPTKQVQHLIDYGLKDTFHGKNITSIEYLYRHAQQIINSVKESALKNSIVNIST